MYCTAPASDARPTCSATPEGAALYLSRRGESSTSGSRRLVVSWGEGVCPAPNSVEGAGGIRNLVVKRQVEHQWQQAPSSLVVVYYYIV